MPIYEYECSEHGLFEAERPMRHSAEPCACPACRGPARRVLSTTRTTLVPRASALARDRNERSQHSPELRRVEARAAPRPSRPALQASHGGRPWMLGHG
jgi:putative FmdB family regulatory protein